MTDPQPPTVACLRRGMWSPFDDNRIGVCARCGHEVIYRPHTPPNAVLVCHLCTAVALWSGELDEVTFGITKRTRAEFIAFLTDAPPEPPQGPQGPRTQPGPAAATRSRPKGRKGAR